MHAVLSSACDRTIAAAAASVRNSGASIDHAGPVLATTILASSLAFIDGSVVNVGLPAIGASFASDGGSLSWIVNGYLLPLSALLLIGGAAGDLYGRRILLMAGIALFAAATVLCAAAQTLSWLLAGRVLQGVGAAMLLPNSLAILGASFAGEARGRAIGIWASVGAAAGAIGPLLGGWLIDAIGWRAMFFVNLPIAAAAFYLAARFVRDNRPETRETLDFGGGALATLALAALTWGLTSASSAKGLDWAASSAIVAGTIFLLLFLVVERQRAEKAMLPLSLFASASFTGLTVLTLLLYGALGGLLVIVPYELIEVSGYTAMEAGAALLPVPLVIALTSSTMGRLAGRIGPRLPLSVGPLIVAGGCALATRIGGPGGYWTTTLPAMLAIAIGMAAAVAPLTTAVLASVKPQQTGIASGFNSAIARTGGLIATALLSVVLAAHGDALTASFQIAAWVGAGVALAAGATAFALVGDST
jgi:EmrB/QacA subfamily drug resistance transporter